jgi:hypothetical protein
MELSQTECVAKAENTVRATGFLTRAAVHEERSVFGEKDDYTAGLTCDERKKLLVVTVAGPDVSETGKFLDLLREAFQAASSAAPSVEQKAPDQLK